MKYMRHVYGIFDVPEPGTPPGSFTVYRANIIQGKCIIRYIGSMYSYFMMYKELVGII